MPCRRDTCLACGQIVCRIAAAAHLIWQGRHVFCRIRRGRRTASQPRSPGRQMSVPRTLAVQTTQSICHRSTWFCDVHLMPPPPRVRQEQAACRAWLHFSSGTWRASVLTGLRATSFSSQRHASDSSRSRMERSVGISGGAEVNYETRNSNDSACWSNPRCR